MTDRISAKVEKALRAAIGDVRGTDADQVGAPLTALTEAERPSA